MPVSPMGSSTWDRCRRPPSRCPASLPTLSGCGEIRSGGAHFLVGTNSCSARSGPWPVLASRGAWGCGSCVSRQGEDLVCGRAPVSVPRLASHDCLERCWPGACPYLRHFRRRSACPVLSWHSVPRRPATGCELAAAGAPARAVSTCFGATICAAVCASRPPRRRGHRSGEARNWIELKAFLSKSGNVTPRVRHVSCLFCLVGHERGVRLPRNAQASPKIDCRR